MKNLLPTCSPPILFNAMYKIKTTPFVKSYLLSMSYSSTSTSSYHNNEMEVRLWVQNPPSACVTY